MASVKSNDLFLIPPLWVFNHSETEVPECQEFRYQSSQSYRQFLEVNYEITGWLIFRHVY